MQTLYISDLDGTLLDGAATLSPFSAEILNHLISAGMHFTVATARTSATVLRILADVDIKLPVILMNGVAIYDVKEGRYVETNTIPMESRSFMFESLQQEGLDGFLYVIEDNCLSTFYERAQTPQSQEFMEERIRRYGKRFTKVDSFESCMHKNIVYFSVADTNEKLQPLYEKIKGDPLLHVEYYRDIYHPDHFYLEICSSLASKYHAAMRLRERYGYDRVVGFGDNYNDLPLFRACDACYAVENAKPEVKAAATGVIGSNIKEGVARFLQNEFVK